MYPSYSFDKKLKKRQNIGLGFFIIIIIAQLTVYKFLWHIEMISTIINSIYLFLFSLYSFSYIFFYKKQFIIIILYLIPGILVLIFQFINILISVFDTNIYGFFGLLLPRVSFVAAPFLVLNGYINIVQLWKYFYYFMFFSVILSLSEYLFVFLGNYTVSLMQIPNGLFLAGKFCIFHVLQDGTAHNRFYSCFGEPGDLAMYLLPAILYAYYYKKYFSLIIFILSFYFTFSLGGYIGLFFLLIIFRLFENKSIKNIFYILSTLCLIYFTSSILREAFISEYESKDESREVRVNNITNFLSNFTEVAINYPFGIPLKSSTAENEKNSLFLGSNFAPGYALVSGGIFSFIGYCLILFMSVFISIISIKKRQLSIEEKVVFITSLVMISYIVQRNSIWDSSLFSFLYSPVFLKFLDSKFDLSKHSTIKNAEFN